MISSGGINSCPLPEHLARPRAPEGVVEVVEVVEGVVELGAELAGPAGIARPATAVGMEIRRPSYRQAPCASPACSIPRLASRLLWKLLRLQDEGWLDWKVDGGGWRTPRRNGCSRDRSC